MSEQEIPRLEIGTYVRVPNVGYYKVLALQVDYALATGPIALVKAGADPKLGERAPEHRFLTLAPGFQFQVFGEALTITSIRVNHEPATHAAVVTLMDEREAGRLDRAAQAAANLERTLEEVDSLLGRTR